MGKYIIYIYKALVVLFCLFVHSNSKAQSETFEAGSLVIDMGVEPQTIDNGLKPYGLIYSLIKDHQIPIYWIIKSGKDKDSTDFVHNGIAYKGGPFIIKSDEVDDDLIAYIDSWNTTNASGAIQYDLLIASVTAEVAMVLKSAPFWTLDADNGHIAEDYLVEAGIPLDAYIFKTPAELGACEDLYVMPHADPTWADHSNLYSWNLDYDGAIWAGCHAVSVLENVYNPLVPTERLNFLMNDPQTMPSGQSAVDFGDHGDAGSDLIYSEESHPIMQFLGGLDQAMNGGSEQIYLPFGPVGWRAQAHLLATDTAHPDVPSLSDGPASSLVFGHGMDDPSRGVVMYSGGHSYNGSSPSDVAAKRSFLNFSFWAAELRSFDVSIANLPSLVDAGTTYPNVTANLSANYPLDFSSATYEWKSSCGAVFSNPSGATTDVEIPTGTEFVSCKIVCVVTFCDGRKYAFGTQNISVQSPPVAVNDLVGLPSGCFSDITLDPLANDLEPNGETLTICGFIPASGLGSGGQFTDNGDGTVSYTPNLSYTGNDEIQYMVCDPNGLVDTAYVYLQTGSLDPFGCLPSQYFGQNENGFAINVLEESSIQGEGGGGALQSPNGLFAKLDNVNDILKVDLGHILDPGDSLKIYFQDADSDGIPVDMNVLVSSGGLSFSFEATFSTAANSIQVASLVVSQPTRYVQIQLANAGEKLEIDALEWIDYECLSAYPIALVDNVNTYQNTPYAIDVMSNDTDPQGTLLNVTAITQPSHGYAALNLDGTITYLSDLDYVGSDSFSYTVCNPAGLCSTSTVNLIVQDDGCNSGETMISGPTQSVVMSNPDEAYIRFDSPSKNYGDCNKLILDQESSKPERILLSYDLSALAPTAVIDSAFVTMQRTGGKHQSTAVDIYALSQAWVEGNSCGSSGDIGVSWDYYEQTLGWSSPGGDYLPTSYATTVVEPVNQDFRWDVSNLVQQWVDGSLVNYGLIMKGDETILDQDAKHEFGIDPTLEIYFRDHTCTASSAYAPVAGQDTASTLEGMPVDVDVLLNDLDPDSPILDVAINTPPANGIASVSGGIISYTPNTNFVGADTLIYTVCDELVQCDQNYLIIEVIPVLVDANDDFANVVQGNTVSVDVTNNDQIDPSCTITSLQIIGGPQWGAANVVGNEINYIPGANCQNTDSLVYEVCVTYSGEVGCSIPECSQATLYFDITIVDTEPPVITCPANIVVTNDPGTCGAVVNYPLPTATDNCQVSGVMLSGGFPSGSLFPVGSIVVSYMALDAAGNSASCNFTVTVQDAEPPIISCPSDVVVPNDPDECSAVVTYSSPTFTDNCPGGSINLTSGLPSGSSFPIGVNEVIYTATDASGNSSSCSFYVTVTDNEAPVINCPSDIVVVNDVGECGAVVNFSNPTYSDNCPGATLSQTGGLPNGTLFPIGTTNMTFEVIDNAGNTASCNFNITVTDSEVPQANCQDITIDIGSDGMVSIVPLQVDAGSVDNCGIAQLDVAPDSFNAVGTYTVTLKVTDIYGNVSTCQSEVTVTDTNAPEAMCQDITVYLDENGEVQIDPMDIDGGSTDNGVIVSYSASPDLFNCADLGSATSALTVVDELGNSSSCYANITVLDTLAPTAICQDLNVLVAYGGGITSISENDINAGSFDNCSIASISIDIADFDETMEGLNVVTLTVVDSSGNISTCQSNVTVEIANVLPDAQDDNYTTLEDEEIIMDVLTNDFDPDNLIDITTLQVPQPPVNGTFIINTDGTITYFPNPDYVGADTLQYAICGNNGVCDTAFVFIDVLPVNDGLYAIPDLNNTLLNLAVQGNVLTNDSDPDLDQFTLQTTPVEGPFHGQLTMNSDGSYTYVPDNGYIGEDYFVYEICDDGAPVKCATAMVYLEVFTNDFTLNEAPIANPNAYLAQINTVISSSLRSNDGDPENEEIAVSYIPVENPQNGTLVINLDGTFTYQPVLDFVGIDSFSYLICDFGIGGGCDTSVVWMQFVEPMGDPALNDAPFAGDDAFIGQEDNLIDGSLLDNDLDSNGDAIQVQPVLLQDVVNGTLTLNPDGTFTYLPIVENWTGTDQFIYQICDSNGLCDVATVYITVVPVNDPLIIDSGNGVPDLDGIIDDQNVLNTPEDTPMEICFEILDEDGIGVNFNSNELLAQNGVLVDPIDLDTCITYVPNENYNGPDTLNVIICDDTGLCDTTQVIVNVLPVNDPPIGVDDFATTDDQTEIDLPILDNDSDIEGDELTISSIENPENGIVIINDDGTITYIPNFGFCGTEVFTYMVCDNGDPVECALVTITIVVTLADSDGDGIPDVLETLEADTDSDGIPDYLDTDSDNDGILDADEAQIDASDPCNVIILDSDNDLIPNHLDEDSDNDGIDDETEGVEDCDEDGIPDYLDPDSCVSDLVIPQGFSPNGDGVGDLWVIEGLLEMYPNATVHVFNRWGDEVYAASPYRNDWNGNGNRNNSGDLPTGTYFYILKLTNDLAPIQGYVYISKN